MAKNIKIESSKNCECEHPELINKIAVGYYGYFDFCKKCNRNKRLKAIYENNEIVRFE